MGVRSEKIDNSGACEKSGSTNRSKNNANTGKIQLEMKSQMLETVVGCMIKHKSQIGKLNQNRFE